MKQDVSITINGRRTRGQVELRTLLVDYIREVAGLTGTHVGCTYEGRCGACTVILNGDAVKSCLILAVQADGARVMTIEGLARNGLHPIQEAFRERHGLQCGYCTPGMLMTAYDLLKTERDLTEDQIRYSLIGNLCRCTGYSHIVEAVQLAAERLRELPEKKRLAHFPE